MTWNVVLSNRAERALARVPARDRQRITQALLGMEKDPLSGDVIPLKGPYAGSYRRRVGPWRIVFTLNWDSQVVGVADIARRTSTTYLPFDAGGPEDYPAAFAAMRAAGAQAVVVMAHPAFNRDAAVLARLALEAGLPTVCEWAEMAQSGCLLGYGPSRSELRRRTAHLVAQIFQGVPPGDLPIEQPTHYEFAINLKTASALGVTIPQSILGRADEVIE